MELVIHYGGGVQGRQGKGRGRKVEEESAGRWKKWGKIMQQCLILCNRKWAKGRKPQKKSGVEAGNTRYGRQEIWILCPLPSKHSVYQIICRCGCSEVLHLY